MEENKEVKKLSYEELEKLANNLYAKCNELSTELQNSNMQNAFLRLDLLFKVVENKSAFSKEFVERCVSEIETMMTIKSEA